MYAIRDIHGRALRPCQPAGEQAEATPLHKHVIGDFAGPRKHGAVAIPQQIHDAPESMLLSRFFFNLNSFFSLSLFLRVSFRVAAPAILFRGGLEGKYETLNFAESCNLVPYFGVAYDELRALHGGGGGGATRGGILLRHSPCK